MFRNRVASDSRASLSAYGGFVLSQKDGAFQSGEDRDMS